MALSTQDFNLLVDALGYRVDLAQEFANALFTPAPLSAALQNNIVIAMANRATADEVINSLQTGNNTLSLPALGRLTDMFAHRSRHNSNIIPLLAFSNLGTLGLFGPLLTFSSYAAFISNTGSTLLLGDVGVGLGGTLTGSPTVNGATNVGNANSIAALAAIKTTYNSLAGKTATSNLTGLNLGGMTLTAGVYKFDSTAQLTGTLTLDAQNNPNAMFVIQVGSALTTAANAIVHLVNGATSDNVYWQVGSSATLGSDTAFAGNILALDSITLDAGASNNGRLLAQTGVLTLNTNIVSPLPVNASAPPLTPTALVISPGNAFVTPVWVASVGATSYNLYYNTVGAPTKLSTKITGAVSGVNLTGLTNSTTYYYVVTAQNAAGESGISPVSSATPTASVAVAPVFSLGTGTYAGTQSITMSSTTPGASLYYTTDGSTPTVFSTLYSGAISVSTTETLQAITIASGYANSTVTSATYTITRVGPAPVNLATAGNYRILAESGISTTAGSAITGNIAVSPIASTAITGFGLILDGSGTFSTSSMVVGDVYAADYAAPTPATLTTAVSDMQAAYTDAASRTSPTATNLGSGNLGGLTLTGGLYNWSTGVTIPTTLTLNGSASDTWIMQVSGTLGLAASTSVVLTGGALASNVFWQVTGAVTLGASSVMQGNILAATSVAMVTSATLHGRALAQTAVTLESNTVAS